ncbi:hypothetical protein EAN04_24570 [Salmonella enterica]|nr:hypothetical protein [Salmonella enterica]
MSVEKRKPIDPRVAASNEAIKEAAVKRKEVEDRLPPLTAATQQLVEKRREKSQLHDAILERRATGDENDRDAARAYMLHLDMQNLDKAIEAALLAENEVRSEIARALDVERRVQKEAQLAINAVRVEELVAELRQMESRFIEIHEELIPAAQTASISLFGSYRFSIKMREIISRMSYV